MVLLHSVINNCLLICIPNTNVTITNNVLFYTMFVFGIHIC